MHRGEELKGSEYQRSGLTDLVAGWAVDTGPRCTFPCWDRPSPGTPLTRGTTQLPAGGQLTVPHPCPQSFPSPLHHHQPHPHRARHRQIRKILTLTKHVCLRVSQEKQFRGCVSTTEQSLTLCSRKHKPQEPQRPCRQERPVS